MYEWRAKARMILCMCRGLWICAFYVCDRWSGASHFMFSYCPGVSLTLCCFLVFSTRRFVLSLALCYFVLAFFSPFSILTISLGEERANLSAFRTSNLRLFWFCLFPLPLVVWEGLRLVIVALLDFSPTLFSYMAFLDIICSSSFPLLMPLEGYEAS